jgi:hypothetical protein
VYIDDNPLTAHKRVFIVSSPLLAGVPDKRGYGSGYTSGPEPLYVLVLKVWTGWGVLGLIVWAISGGGGDPHVNRIPFVIFVGGGVSLLIAWLSRIKVDGDVPLFLGGAWIIAGIISAIAYGSRHPAGKGPGKDDWGSATTTVSVRRCSPCSSSPFFSSWCVGSSVFFRHDSASHSADAFSG